MKKLAISLTFLFAILNLMSAQYTDPKWEFGGEVGYAWVGYPGQSFELDIFDKHTQNTSRFNRGGFRVMASVKYNLIGRIQILGGVGFLNAKGSINKSSTETSFFGNSTTTTSEQLIQKYNLIEIPIYCRFFLLGEKKSEEYGFNIFADLGKNFKIPLESELSFSQDYSLGTLQVHSSTGNYFALGFSINNRTTIAFTSSGIKTHDENNKTNKFSSHLRSLSLAVFF